MVVYLIKKIVLLLSLLLLFLLYLVLQIYNMQIAALCQSFEVMNKVGEISMLCFLTMCNLIRDDRQESSGTDLQHD